jgi:hypothetical protein
MSLADIGSTAVKVKWFKVNGPNHMAMDNLCNYPKQKNISSTSNLLISNNKISKDEAMEINESISQEIT